MEKTTIQINTGTLARLKTMKRYERESYDEVLNQMLDEAEEEILTEKEIEEIKQALEEIKRGEIFSIQEVAKEFNVKLN
jgi:predicted house-cleaning noncanonical NTP pyrophosphatase (MazG superfamily)